MEVAKVTKQDAQAVVQLINVLRIGKYEVSGADMSAISETMKWVQSLATGMAAAAKAEAVPASAPTPTQKKVVDPEDTGIKNPKINPVSNIKTGSSVRNTTSSRK